MKFKKLLLISIAGMLCSCGSNYSSTSSSVSGDSAIGTSSQDSTGLTYVDYTTESDKSLEINFDTPEQYKAEPVFNRPENLTPTEGLAYTLLDDDTYEVSGTEAVKDKTAIVIADTYDGKQVTKIKDSAFSYFKQLVTVSIPEGIKEIGDEAFVGCSSLKDIIIPDSVETIGKYILKEASSLERIKLPFVGKNSDGSGSTSALWLFGADSYGGMTCSAYYPASLKQVVISEGCERLYAGAIQGCKNVESIKLPSTLKTIGDCAFASCRSLIDISIPDSVEEIGEYAFSGVKAQIRLPEALGKIGFQTCYNISNSVVKVPRSVNLISECAFQDCHNLRSVIIPKNLDKICEGAFENTSHTDIDEITDIYYEGSKTAFKDHCFYRAFPPEATVHYNYIY